ncbi:MULTISPECIES: hypothetical protein [Acinetobacter]|jgi:hypothetical protein|uniref:Uncharacterized protein n=1 Tax=Acinetobacter junii TaxID=40215 RepID=A0ABU8ZKS4_ACIJU|nr:MULTISPECIES: hypothetical protein [Acinetobacter]MCY0274345.1 hypothetical protein [Acinetobacter baumannii]PZT84253.1 MAG: hypothetical protein DI627_16390 [Acinetobacter sp.]UAB18214.1 hypothetical protein H2786_19570 [Acinetobacter baumannii]
MAQTCSRVATIRQSLLNDFNPEVPLEFPKKATRASQPFFQLLSVTHSVIGTCVSARLPNNLIYNLSDEERDKLSNLTLKRIEKLSENIDEYDGAYLEI